MPNPRFDTYYRYAELTALLHAYAETHPQLLRVASMGKSHEGRDLWVATVTNFASGTDTDKPAFWIDGNIHATEVAASMACLYLVDHLVTQYGSNQEVTRCLDTRAFYICPRLNPDGAELALADVPKFIRSSTRPYPYDEEHVEGLIHEDVDGDGRVLTMRVPDKNGPWKADSADPRLLVRRDPVETGGAHRIRLVVQNTGWLPTYVCKKALERKLTRGVVCYIDLPHGAVLEAGELRQMKGELEGRAYKPSTPSGWLAADGDATDERTKAEWVVRAPKGTILKLTARHERAGTVRADLTV